MAVSSSPGESQTTRASATKQPPGPFGPQFKRPRSIISPFEADWYHFDSGTAFG